MIKNVTGQKVAILAWDTAADAGKTGDQANITAQISKDGGASAATNDTNPTQLDATNHPGVYIFDLTQAETNADLVVIYPDSSTAGVVIRPLIFYPTNLTAVKAGYLDELAAANIPADVDAIKAKTDNLPANTSTELDAIDAALVAIDNFVDDLETRLTAARAGYLDNLSAGAAALESTLTSIKGLGWAGETLVAIMGAGGLPFTSLKTIAFNVDDLELRLTADRAGYLDNLSAGAVALEATAQTIKKYIRNFIKVNKTTGIYTLYNDASGVELCPSPTCAVDFFDIKGVGWTHDAGNTQYDCDGTQVADSDLTEAGLLVSGVTYRVQFVISNYSAGNLCAVCGTQEGTDRAANGTWVNYILANGTSFTMRADAAFVGSIDSISIQSAAVLETGTIADDGTLKTRTPD